MAAQRSAVATSSFIKRMLAFGPMLWYDYNFDASKLWEGVQINSIGAEIIWGPLFTYYDTAQALRSIQYPIFLALGRHDYFNPPHIWQKYFHFSADLTLRIFEKSGDGPQYEEPKNFDAELM